MVWVWIWQLDEQSVQLLIRQQGRSDGGYIGIYTLPKSDPDQLFYALIAADVVRLLVYRTVVSCSKNDTHPKWISSYAPVRQLVELLDWQSNCINIGLTVDPTIDPTVKITGQPVSRTQASDANGRLPRYEAKCVQRTRFQWGSVPLRADVKGTELPAANILIPLERQLIALQHCRWQFLMKLCSRLLVLYCRNCMKGNKFRYLIPIFRKLGRRRTLVDGSLESPCTTSYSS